MPEGAEVRYVGNALSTAAGHVIREGKIISGRYARSQIDLSPLVGATIERVIAMGAYHDEHPITPHTGFSNLCYGQTAGLKGGMIETFTDKMAAPYGTAQVSKHDLL